MPDGLIPIPIEARTRREAADSAVARQGEATKLSFLLGIGISDRDAVLANIEALQQRATATGLSLRVPPPEPTSCCGRGCNGCVWEGYYSAVAWWHEEAALQLLASPERSNSY